jgi:hypothetical protein
VAEESDDVPGESHDVEATGSVSVGVTARAEPVLSDDTAEAYGTVTNPPTAFVASFSIHVERLVGDTMVALQDENSRLRAELAAAQLRVEMLERALAQVNEAKATGRKSLIRTTLGVVGSILLAATGGAVGGYAEGASSEPVDVTVEVEQPGPSATSALDLLVQCDLLLAAVDDLPEHLPDAT